LISQSQSSDEFWITCVPDGVSDLLFSCPVTSFRETQVTIDGQPAGVAPVYPWLFTGAVDAARDTDGYCYHRSITAANGVLTSLEDGQGCGGSQ
jgi:hypothetical protein